MTSTHIFVNRLAIFYVAAATVSTICAISAWDTAWKVIKRDN